MSEHLTAAGLPVDPLDFAFRPKKKTRKPATPDSEPPTAEGATPAAAAPAAGDESETPPSGEQAPPAGEPGQSEPKPARWKVPSKARVKRAPGRPLGTGRPVLAEESTQLVAYLPEELSEQLRLAAARRRQPRGDVIIAAAAALAGEAPDLIAAGTSEPEPTQMAGFTITASSRAKPRRIPVSFQVSGANRDALQALTVNSGALDRSHLLTVLLEVFLERDHG